VSEECPEKGNCVEGAGRNQGSFLSNPGRQRSGREISDQLAETDQSDDEGCRADARAKGAGR
jgi:hypothetical protein